MDLKGAKLALIGLNVRVFPLVIMVTLFIYFIVMDVTVYQTLQQTTLVKERLWRSARHSVFHPLTVKLLTMDQWSHYVLKPITWMFADVTKLCNNFYFISPNVISGAHAILGIVIITFVSSNSLKHRQIGVLLFEIRTFLDVLDGVVYRCRANISLYRAEPGNFGGHVDNICDIIGVVSLLLGTLFYQIRTATPKLENTILPTTELKMKNGSPVVSKKNVIALLSLAAFGTLLALAGHYWETFVIESETVFEEKMNTSAKEALQTKYLHSFQTWALFWSWKVAGQQIIHYMCIAIFIDKVREFTCLSLTIGYPVVTAMAICSQSYIDLVRSELDKVHVL